MRMLKVGGRLFLFTTANNYCGHGFYQVRARSCSFGCLTRRTGSFSRSFCSSEYGIRAGFSLKPTCYQMTDPAVVRARSVLYTKSRVLCVVQAQRLSRKIVTPPLQSDYVRRWCRQRRARGPGSRRFRRRCAACMPPCRSICGSWPSNITRATMRFGFATGSSIAGFHTWTSLVPLKRSNPVEGEWTDVPVRPTVMRSISALTSTFSAQGRWLSP